MPEVTISKREFEITEKFLTRQHAITFLKQDFAANHTALGLIEVGESVPVRIANIHAFEMDGRIRHGISGYGHYLQVSCSDPEITDSLFEGEVITVELRRDDYGLIVRLKNL